MNGNFDIESMKPTNKDINIVFSPSYNVTSYTYQVYKDNIPINSVNVDNQNPVTIALSETGSYKIIVMVNLLDGNIDTITSGEYIIDKEAPKISISDKNIQINPTKNKNVISCSANDNYNGNLNDKINSNIDSLKLNSFGTYTYTCMVEDEAGNKAYCKRTARR